MDMHIYQWGRKELLGVNITFTKFKVARNFKNVLLFQRACQFIRWPPLLVTKYPIAGLFSVAFIFALKKKQQIKTDSIAHVHVMIRKKLCQNKEDTTYKIWLLYGASTQPERNFGNPYTEFHM